jgi:predicted Ser/Thr protein kinase
MDETPFGRYRLVQLLGRGGMGEVWRAYDTAANNRTVAIKLLPPHLAGDETFVRRFRREADAAAQLNNPHIIPIHNYGEIDGRLYVDMRLIEGRDLQAVLADGPLEPGRSVRIIEQVAKALHAAHKVGLVHRDVKPSNILVDEDDFAYLIDFGIARGADETRMTGTGNVIGSWAYMSPERLQAGQVDARTDIYALACVLYECLTGCQPYPGDTLEQQVTAHLTAPPPRPSITDPDVPVALDTVVATGMAKQPDDRYPTTVELAHAARDAITTPIPTAAGPTMQAPAPAGQPAFSLAATGLSPDPSAATQLRPPPQTPQPVAGSGAQRVTGSKRLWGVIVAAAAVIGVVLTVVLVMTRGDSGSGSASAPAGITAADGTPSTVPFAGTYSVDFGPRTDLSGGALGQGSATEAWDVRSACGANGCVQTASRASGTTLLSSKMVFDDVDGHWLAVAVEQGRCAGANTEIWQVFSLQPRSGGTLTGEFSTFSPAGCADKRTVTFSRTGDARVDGLEDPASLPPRVVSPAQALHGRYHETLTFSSDGATQENDFVVRTDCLRGGDRCMSYFYDPKIVTPLVFTNGKWTRSANFDTACPTGGQSHVSLTAEYPLPNPPQDPIAMLTGQGNSKETGSACIGGDFDEKFVRTGD